MRTSIYAKILGIAIELIPLMVVVAIASSFLVDRVGAGAIFFDRLWRCAARAGVDGGRRLNREQVSAGGSAKVP